MYWFGLNFKYAINRFKEFNAYLIPKVEKIITVSGTIEEIRTFYSHLFFYKKDPKNKYVLLGLAVAQQNSGFTESAIATYEELLKIDPNNLNASLNMLGLLNQRYPAVAYRRLKELWSENTQNAGIAAQIGLTSASMGNIEEATRFLEIASTLEPGNATHYYNIAVIADRAGDYKGAVEYYQKALEVDITYGGGRTIPRDEVYDRLAHLRRL